MHPSSRPGQRRHELRSSSQALQQPRFWTRPVGGLHICMHTCTCAHTCTHMHVSHAHVHMPCHTTLRYACTHAHAHVHTHVAVGGALCRVQHRRTSPDTHQHRACRYCTCREGARAWGLRDDSGRTALPIQRPLLWPRSPEILTTGSCVSFFISSFVAERRHLC